VLEHYRRSPETRIEVVDGDASVEEVAGRVAEAIDRVAGSRT
jgi:thymidylate kinase